MMVKALRHGRGIDRNIIDQDSFANLTQLCRALKVSEVEAREAAEQEPRLELSPGKTRVRAIQGHSLKHVAPNIGTPIDIEDVPQFLFHATSAAAARAILAKGPGGGLKPGTAVGGPGRRPHVYLSVQPITKPNRPVIMGVAAHQAALEHGIEFKVTGVDEGVYICKQTIPVSCVWLLDDDELLAEYAAMQAERSMGSAGGM
jgi:RNA:NAD 2'-phosphotransferase (TPT1/KptA family)